MRDAKGQIVLDFMQRHRTVDPVTSVKTGQEIINTGTAAAHCQIILNCLRQHNGSNQYELAEYLHGILTRDQIWRRRADLIQNGFVKIDGERNGCGLWWIR
jgi:hypothetical protein